MSGPKAASKAGCGGSGISAADRKLINTVKEVATKFSEEEIYAMLKECNRDPNDTAQRLLTQDNFHLVTRKRDRKKETGIAKDAPESRQSSTASYGRGGRISGVSGGRGPGRGPSSTKNDEVGRRGRAAAVKENGVPFVTKSSMPVGGGLSYSQSVQPKNSFNNAVNKNLSTSSVYNGEALQETLSASLDGGWPASSGNSMSTALQGAWLAGSGHGTIADMLKGIARKPVPPSSSSISGETICTAPESTSLEQFPGTSVHSSAEISGVNVSYEYGAQSPISARLREAGAGGLPRFAGDMSSSGLQDEESTHYTQTGALEEHIPSASGYQDHTADLQDGQSGSQESQFSSCPSYHELQFAESQKESSNLDWNSQLLTRGEAPCVVERCVPDGPSSPPSLSPTVRKLQEFNVGDNHSVIIPDHIRVSDAECTMLSFGSLDAGFDGLSSTPSLRSEDVSSDPSLRPETESLSFAVSESAATTELISAMSSLSTSLPSAVPEHEDPMSSVPMQNVHTRADVIERDVEDERKEEEELAVVPAQQEYPSSYSVIDSIPSDHASQYATISVDTNSRPRDVSAVLPQYDNSTYYSGGFRSVPELDSRYSAFSQLTTSGKLATSRPAETTGQSASPEVLNTSVYASSNAVGGQTMAALNNGPSGMCLPQHSVHPYGTQPSGLPVGPFATNVLGYQYMPPGFSYVQQGPYQHNYVSSNNYHQVPTAVAAGALKYPVPQYKTAGPVAGGMHSTMSPSSVGYAGYPNSQPAINLPATSGNTSNFDDAAPQHYKENSMYMSSQQIDGPSVWLQNQLARDAQNASFYGATQSQPTRYSQSTSLLTHTHPASVYANLYHQQQSGSNPSAHQLLHQQPGLGSMGALGTQINSYPQNQRAQPSWAPGPY